ncbi:hypothetical protein DSL64_01420 [Dyadobacter luteus]|uniref:Uncharacterized protein n=1 Tax=Dyadobacter luteus TaxID=2259619 RepID=A0A3D8YI70_9BACT|nr:hypothetical protein DSL64_01420 [Dyadobacter luteus]
MIYLINNIILFSKVSEPESESWTQIVKFVALMFEGKKNHDTDVFPMKGPEQICAEMFMVRHLG